MENNFPNGQAGTNSFAEAIDLIFVGLKMKTEPEIIAEGESEWDTFCKGQQAQYERRWPKLTQFLKIRCPARITPAYRVAYLESVEFKMIWLQVAEEAGQWKSIHRYFEGWHFEEKARETGNQDLVDRVVALRQRVDAAMEYVRVHGPYSLLDWDHPDVQSLWWSTPAFRQGVRDAGVTSPLPDPPPVKERTAHLNTPEFRIGVVQRQLEAGRLDSVFWYLNDYGLEDKVRATGKQDLIDQLPDIHQRIADGVEYERIHGPYSFLKWDNPMVQNLYRRSKSFRRELRDLGIEPSLSWP